MAMVKAVKASGMFRSMKYQFQALSLVHTHVNTELKYPSWISVEDMDKSRAGRSKVQWKGSIEEFKNMISGSRSRSSSSSSSESESESESQLKSRVVRPPMGNCLRFCPRPKIPPWKERVEELQNLPASRRIHMEGRDYKHWRVYLKPLRGHPTRDQFVSYYLRTMSQLLHSEEEASKKIYSMATKHYFAFGANISPEQADIISELPNVLLVYPDYYQNPEVKRYSWDYFVNGQVLSYDPKHYPTPGEKDCLCDEELEITRLPVRFRKYAD